MRINKTIGTLTMAAMIIALAVPAMAGNGSGSSRGKGGGDRLRTQSRDGSCRDLVEQRGESQELAQMSDFADMIRLMLHDKTRDQLEDGSCQEG